MAACAGQPQDIRTAVKNGVEGEEHMLTNLAKAVDGPDASEMESVQSKLCQPL